MFSLLIHLRFLILSFIYGSKLFKSYTEVGCHGILDLFYDPWALTFLVQCSFLVFSTNKLWVIMFFCKFVSKKKRKKKTNESGNFLVYLRQTLNFKT